MHLVFMAESYPEHLQKLTGYLNSLPLKDNKACWDIAVREIKLFDLVFPEEQKEQVLGIIKGITKKHHSHLMGKNPFTSILSSLVPRLKAVDLNEIKELPHKEPWWAYIYPLGVMQDKYWDPAKDMLKEEKESENEIECL